MKNTIFIVLVSLLAGCGGGQLVVTEKDGKVWKKTVQDARVNAGGLVEWQDDAGQWHEVRAASAQYQGWYGGKVKQ